VAVHARRFVVVGVFNLLAVGSVLAMDTVVAAEAPADANAPVAFDLWEFQLKGNTLLPQITIERALYPFLGPGRTLDDLEKAQSALEKVYVDAGYQTVRVDLPQQEVKEGVVHLKVVEGRVGRTRVSGARYVSATSIREHLPALAEDQVPNLPKVQSELTALNLSSQDYEITPVLRPGKTPGTLEVELKVSDRVPLHGSLGLNNRYSASTSQLRAEAQLSYDNLWQAMHSLSVQYQTAPEKPDEVQVAAATYMMPLGLGSHRLVVYGIDSSSSVATVGDISVLGKGNIYGVRGVFPLGSLGANGQGFHSLIFGGDYKSFDETLNLGDSSLERPISYGLMAIGYSGQLRSKDRLTRFQLNANLGQHAFGNEWLEFTNRRVGAKPNFYYLTGSAERVQPLILGTTIALKTNFQLADQPLIGTEQFSAGGVDSVRGYLVSAGLGDRGVRGSVELRRPILAGRWPNTLSDSFVRAFVDGAVLSVIDTEPEEIDIYRLAGSGVGLQTLAFKKLQASLDVGWALREVRETQPGDIQAHFFIEYKF